MSGLSLSPPIRPLLGLPVGPSPLFDCTGNGGRGRIVKRILYALAAKTAIPAVLSTLVTARKNAINGSSVSYDALRIAYIRVDFPDPVNSTDKGQSGSD